MIRFGGIPELPDKAGMWIVLGRELWGIGLFVSAHGFGACPWPVQELRRFDGIGRAVRLLWGSCPAWAAGCEALQQINTEAAAFS